MLCTTGHSQCNEIKNLLKTFLLSSIGALPLALLYKHTKCCPWEEEKKGFDKMLINLKIKLFSKRSLPLCYLVYNTLYQILSFIFLPTAFSKFEQQGYGWKYSGLSLEV